MLKVRRARKDDLEFVSKLTLDTVDQGISTTRDIPNDVVVARARENLGILSEMLGRRRDFSILIAEAEEPVGFLILEFRNVEETTGEKQTLIFNMAVRPEYLGKRVDRLLVAEAARLSHQRGYRFMTARITASNERALFAALRQGFEIERYQVTMGCGPDGPEPLPGRSREERAHDLSRVKRHRQVRNRS